MNVIKEIKEIQDDPAGHVNEIMEYAQHLEMALDIFAFHPNVKDESLCSQLMIISKVAKLYKNAKKKNPKMTAAKNKLKSVSTKILHLFTDSNTGHMVVTNDITNQINHLHSDVRGALIDAIFAFRNHDYLLPQDVLPTLFQMFRLRDKGARRKVYNHIVGDLTHINSKKKNDHVNNKIIKFLYRMVNDQNKTAAKKSLDVLTTLYRKAVWTDANTVNVISEAVFNPDTRIMVSALNFFLGDDPELEEKEEKKEKKQQKSLAGQLRSVQLHFKNLHSRRTHKRVRKFEGTMKKLKYQMNKPESDAKKKVKQSFASIHLLNNPQKFVEKLFGRLRNTHETFEVRLLMLDVISRTISVHKLHLFNFYPYIQRYMEPHYEKITKLLAIAAQSVHDLVPEEVVSPLVFTVANNFVNDKSKDIAVTAGLNCIREMCRRQPRVMTKELMRDLAQYTKSKSMMIFHAARGLVALYKLTAPKLLDRKMRGNAALINEMPEFGEEKVQEGIEGIELLEESEEEGEEGEEEGEEDEGEEGEEEEEGEAGEEEKEAADNKMEVEDEPSEDDEEEKKAKEEKEQTARKFKEEFADILKDIEITEEDNEQNQDDGEDEEDPIKKFVGVTKILGADFDYTEFKKEDPEKEKKKEEERERKRLAAKKRKDNGEEEYDEPDSESDDEVEIDEKKLENVVLLDEKETVDMKRPLTIEGEDEKKLTPEKTLEEIQSEEIEEEEDKKPEEKPQVAPKTEEKKQKTSKTEEKKKLEEEKSDNEEAEAEDDKKMEVVPDKEEKPEEEAKISRAQRKKNNKKENDEKKKQEQIVQRNEIIKKRKLLTGVKILTQEELLKIDEKKRNQLKSKKKKDPVALATTSSDIVTDIIGEKSITLGSNKKNKKRKREDDSDQEGAEEEEEDENSHKKKDKRMGHSKTNKEKSKLHKNFHMMVNSRKVRGKAFLSTHERLKKKKESDQKQLKHALNVH